MLSAGSCVSQVGGFFKTLSNSFWLASTERVLARKQKLNVSLFAKAACFTSSEGKVEEAAEGMITALYWAASGWREDEDASQDSNALAEKNDKDN